MACVPIESVETSAHLSSNVIIPFGFGILPRLSLGCRYLGQRSGMFMIMSRSGGLLLPFDRPGFQRMEKTTIMLLVVWTLWNVKNTRVFHNLCSLLSIVLAKINKEASTWATVGNKHLGDIIPGE